MVGAPLTNYTWKATPTSGVAFSFTLEGETRAMGKEENG